MKKTVIFVLLIIIFALAVPVADEPNIPRYCSKLSILLTLNCMMEKFISFCYNFFNKNATD